MIENCLRVHPLFLIKFSEVSMKITSKDNPKLKEVIQLRKKKSERSKKNRFIVEGYKEVLKAIENGFQPHYFFCSEGFSFEGLKKDNSSIPFFLLTNDLFSKVALRESSAGVVGVFTSKNRTQLSVESAVALVGVEKPGNIGAICRTAAAVGMKNLYLVDTPVDRYHPNIVRSSVGHVFDLNVVQTSSEDLLSFCEKNRIQLFAAALSDRAKDYRNVEVSNPSVLLLGEEASGLSPRWLSKSEVVKIPMNPEVDSLNVSVSAAILLYGLYLPSQ